MANDLKNLSVKELKKIKKLNQQKLKKEYAKYKKKQKLIADIKKIKKIRERITHKPKQKPKQKPKTFDDYFQECIKNKIIPPDTPSYFRKALKRAINEHNQGIVKEKSSLDGFANKYVINGEHGITTFEFFKSQSTYLKEFLRNHRNIKVRFVLVCLTEKVIVDGNNFGFVQDKAYFNSDTYINLESTDVKKLLSKVIRIIFNNLNIYQMNGSGWYFKEVINLGIHTANYNPMRGSSYIPLPDWIIKKRAILNIINNDEKCFLWCVLRYIHPKKKNDSRIADL